MANRFDTYVRTNYVGEPIEYYQMGVQAKEAEYGSQLQGLGQDLDVSNNVMAAYGPDVKLKEEILTGLRKDIEGITRQKLDTPQALMQLNKIINNKERIDKLSAIQGNALEYQRVLKEMQDYEKDTGNSINNTRLKAAIEQYNRSGQFQSGFMRGQSPGKYIDVVKDVQEVLSKVKGNVEDIIDMDGRWIVKTERESLDLSDLMRRAGVAIDDPKYQRQLQDYMFHNAYNAGGGDANAGYKRYYDNTLSTVSDNLEQLQQDIKFLDPKNPKHQKNYEALQNRIKTLQSQKTQLEQTKDYAGLYSRNLMGDLALQAATPFVYSKVKRDIEANPFELAAYKARLDRENDRIKAAEFKALLTPPSHIGLPLTSGVGTQYTNLQATQFGKDFGDLEMDRQGNPIIRKAEVAGSQAEAILPGVAPGMDLNTPTQIDHRDKWVKFAQYAIHQGRKIDMEKIKRGDTEELAKLGRVYKGMKESTAQDKIVGYGFQLGGNGIDKEAVGNYILSAINSAGGVVTDDQGKQVRFADAVANAKGEVNIDPKGFQGTVQPGTNRISFSYNGKTMYVNPDKETQDRLKPLSDLFNSQNKVGYGQLSNGAELLSYNQFDNAFNMTRTLLQPMTQVLNDEEFAKVLGSQFKTNIAKSQANKMKDDEVYAFFRDKNGVTKQVEYGKLQNNPEHYQAMMANPNEIALFSKTTDSKGKSVFRAVSPFKDGGIEDVIQFQARNLLEPGQPLGHLIDKQSPVFDQKLQLWQMQQNMYPEVRYEQK